MRHMYILRKVAGLPAVGNCERSIEAQRWCFYEVDITQLLPRSESYPRFEAALQREHMQRISEAAYH